MILCATWAFGVPSSAEAGPGHDHGPPAPTERAEALPRGSSHSDQFEIVVVRAENQLLVFLDDYAGNAPVAGAELDILVDGDLGPVTEVAPGVYAASWEAPADAEEIDVTVIVAAGARSDLLLATLLLPHDDHHDAQPAGASLGSLPGGLQLVLLVVAFLLGGGAAYLLQHRRQATPANDGAKGQTAATATDDHVTVEQAQSPRLLRTGS